MARTAPSAAELFMSGIPVLEFSRISWLSVGKHFPTPPALPFTEVCADPASLTNKTCAFCRTHSSVWFTVCYLQVLSSGYVRSSRALCHRCHLCLAAQNRWSLPGHWAQTAAPVPHPWVPTLLVSGKVSELSELCCGAGAILENKRLLISAASCAIKAPRAPQVLNPHYLNSSETDLIFLLEDKKVGDWNQGTRRWWLLLLPLELQGRSWDFPALKYSHQKDLFLLLKEADTLYSDSKQYLKKGKNPSWSLDSCFAKVAPSSPWSLGKGERGFHKKRTWEENPLPPPAQKPFRNVEIRIQQRVTISACTVRSVEHTYCSGYEFSDLQLSLQVLCFFPPSGLCTQVTQKFLLPKQPDRASAVIQHHCWSCWWSWPWISFLWDCWGPHQAAHTSSRAPPSLPQQCDPHNYSIKQREL